MSSEKPEWKPHHTEIAKRFERRLARTKKPRKTFPTFAHYMKWIHEHT